jgi:predicted component of type VI protein secretion system
MDILLSIRAKADSTTREVRSAIGDGLVIGRGAEQGVLLDGPDLSREHLVITAEGTNLFLTDLSSNGTWLNGTRLKRSVKTRISVDDLIEIPGYALNLKFADQPEKVAAAPVPPPPPPAAVPEPVAPPPALSEEPKGLLSPVFGFIGSFSFMEKALVVVGLGGLLLLFAYFGS